MNGLSQGTKARIAVLAGLVIALTATFAIRGRNPKPSPPPVQETPFSVETEMTAPPPAEAPTAPEPPPAQPSAQRPNPAPPPASTKRDFSNPLAPPSIPPESGPLSADTNPSASAEMGKIFVMLRDYRTITGENPVGTNAEIMKAMMGDNPKGATLGPPEDMSLNGEGELLDPWGSPYFFHQVSRDVMEVISPGPDKRRGTEDDLISR